MTSAVSQTLPLELLEAGERGVVVNVDGRPELVVRLAEMGLHTGASVRMIRPGSPCIIESIIKDFRYDSKIPPLCWWTLSNEIERLAGGTTRPHC